MGRKKASSAKPKEQTVSREAEEKEMTTNEVISLPNRKLSVCLISRIDWGSPGYRKWLVDLGLRLGASESAKFVILAGGLVDAQALKGVAPSPKKAEEYGTFVAMAAKELSEAIPTLFRTKEKKMKIYIVTSPVYDGQIGKDIARKLSEIREDIRFWDEGSGRNPLKQIARFLHTLVPIQRSMPSQYFGAAARKMYLRHMTKSKLEPPHLYVLGCLASSIFKPGKGEYKTPWTTVPALHSLEDKPSAENQVGVKIIDFHNADEFSIVNISLKDLVMKEREYISVPPSATEVQKNIIEIIIKNGPVTRGQMYEELRRRGFNISKEDLKKESEVKYFRASVEFDESSDKFFFGNKWLQENIKYKMPSEKAYINTNALGYACLHGGSISSDNEFFVKAIPPIIVKHDIRYLIGAGDFVEGIKHDLLTKGLIICGINVTQQEKFVAYLNGHVMFRAMLEQFKKDPAWNKREKSGVSSDELKALVEKYLVVFLYKSGNHDDWAKAEGFTPLVVFRNELVKYLKKKIDLFMKQEFNVHVPGLGDVVEAHVLEADKHCVKEAGLCIELFHPHTARAITPSQKAQGLLDKSDCQLIFAGNWHVAEVVEHWDFGRGQRVVMTLGTVKTRSEYEDNRGKKVDFGVGVLKATSYDGRIIRSEVSFYNDPYLKEDYDNWNLIREYLKSIGVEDVE